MRINSISHATLSYRKNNTQNQAQVTNPIQASQSFCGTSEAVARHATKFAMHKDGMFVKLGRTGIDRKGLSAVLDMLIPKQASDALMDLSIRDIVGFVLPIQTPQHLKLAAELAKSAVEEGNGDLLRFMEPILLSVATPQAATEKLKALHALSFDSIVQKQKGLPVLTAEDIGVTLMKTPDAATATAMAEDILKRK